MSTRRTGTRKAADARSSAYPARPEEQPETAAELGVPVRLLAHDWPFLYSVLPNGDLVRNNRVDVPLKPPSRRQRATALVDDD